jgi:hypothetical protein
MYCQCPCGYSGRFCETGRWSRITRSGYLYSSLVKFVSQFVEARALELICFSNKLVRYSHLFAKWRRESTIVWCPRDMPIWPKKRV